MDDQPENLDELLHTPDCSGYYKVLDTHLTNKATRKGFYMDKLVIMDIKNLNYVFRKYDKKARSNAPRFLAIAIQRFPSQKRAG